MRHQRFVEGTVFMLGLLTVPVAQAHNLAHQGASLSAGFVHPLLGWDHLLAMLAVGLWAAQQNGRALWRLPLVFVVLMTVGAIAAGAGLLLPAVETGIATSLLVLGLLLAFAVRPPAIFSMALVGLFALFHGFAHGAEMPQASSALNFALGFILATTLLHLLGIHLGRLCRGELTTRLLRIGGSGIAASSILTWV
jgi:urease accessory protein